MDDRTMYMCMEIIALIRVGRKMIHLLLPDTLFFLKRHLFVVPYISGHVPYRVFLLSVNVRTPKIRGGIKKF